MKEVAAAEREMNTYKIIYESRLEDLERFKKSLQRKKTRTEKTEAPAAEQEGGE